MNHEKAATEFKGHSDAAAANWTAAQSLSFSFDLVPAALRLRQLLAAVDRHRCLYSGPAVSCAIQRYENCWLPLLAEHHDKAIMPPLDCAWIWCCHRLSPLAYATDCERLHGQTLGTTQHLTSSDDTKAMSQRLWELRFPSESFELDLSRFDTLSPDAAANGHQSNIQYDLHSAVERQSQFYYQISESHMGDDRYLRSAEQRYKGFLYLLKMTDSKVFLVPTYDVDLMWHAHQLHPQAYAHDTKAILGTVLQHDDTDSDRSPGHKLHEGFLQTSKLWFESYGRAYERAGAMYRGEPPQPIHNATWMSSVSSGVTDDFGEESFLVNNEPVAIRQVTQVYLSVVGARNIPSLPRGTLRVRLRILKKCSAFKLDTPSVPFSSSTLLRHEHHAAAVWWNQSWSLQAETSTQGFSLELLFKPSNVLGKIASGGKTVLGRVELLWKSVLESPSLSCDGWLSVARQDSKKTVPYLFVSVSVTPPVVGPQLFRTINSMPTDDTGKMDLMGDSVFTDRKGCWITRTVLDHANREVFIVRIRYSDGLTIKYKRTPENEKCIKIHGGGWVYRGRDVMGIPTAESVASAEQMIGGHETMEMLANERRWGFFGNTSHLVVRRVVTTTANTGTLPVVHVELGGCLADKMWLISGRKLQYEVKGASATDEEGFVTVIRHQPSYDTATAQATALFNWRTGVMEVSPNESVVLVLLLSSIICASVIDMEDLKVKFRGAPSAPDQIPKNTAQKSRDEWESVTMEFGADVRKRQPEMAPYALWWRTDGMVWASAFYRPENGGFLGASGCGAAGACGGGACGGSAWGGATGVGGCGGGGCIIGGCGGFIIGT